MLNSLLNAYWLRFNCTIYSQLIWNKHGMEKINYICERSFSLMTFIAQYTVRVNKVSVCFRHASSSRSKKWCSKEMIWFFLRFIFHIMIVTLEVPHWRRDVTWNEFKSQSLYCHHRLRKVCVRGWNTHTQRKRKCFEWWKCVDTCKSYCKVQLLWIKHHFRWLSSVGNWIVRRSFFHTNSSLSVFVYTYIVVPFFFSVFRSNPRKWLRVKKRSQDIDADIV